MAEESETENNGTCLVVMDKDDILTALLNLKKENFISEDFYNDITRNFPKAGSGTVNILEQTSNTPRLRKSFFKHRTFGYTPVVLSSDSPINQSASLPEIKNPWPPSMAPMAPSRYPTNICKEYDGASKITPGMKR